MSNHGRNEGIGLAPEHQTPERSWTGARWRPGFAVGRALLCLLLAAALLAGCGRRAEQVYNTQLLALGTLVDITIWGVDQDKAVRGVQAAQSELNKVHNTWHAWKPSTLTELNQRLAAGETVPVDAETRELLLQAAGLARASGELFDPAIGRLVGLWGFHSDDLPQGPPPPRAEIERLMKPVPTMDDLIIGKDTVRSRNPLLELDFGGFAKGLAVDRSIAALRALGIENAIVNAGGDLRAIGRRGDRPWRIGIRHPTKPGIIASLETEGDESIFTSGNYERYYIYQGKRYHHIIDPRTGYPAEGAVSATVIHDNDEEGTADSASTALLVAGPRDWRRTAEQMGIKDVMLIDKDLNVYLTPSMAKRVHFEIDPPPHVIIAGPEPAPQPAGGEPGS